MKHKSHKIDHFVLKELDVSNVTLIKKIITDWKFAKLCTANCILAKFEKYNQLISNWSCGPERVYFKWNDNCQILFVPNSSQYCPPVKYSHEKLPKRTWRNRKIYDANGCLWTIYIVEERKEEELRHNNENENESREFRKLISNYKAMKPEKPSVGMDINLENGKLIDQKEWFHERIAMQSKSEFSGINES